MSEPWILDRDAGEVLSKLGIEPPNGSVLADEAQNGEIWNHGVGITTVVAAIAETGSLMLAAGPGRARLASLAPVHHVALVRKDQIVASLDDAIECLGDRTAVWITGPSRTADIEGVLIMGIHGPKTLWVVPID
jgi:L-lactate utilization protein LutC